MPRATDFLVEFRRLTKLYEGMLRPVCEQYGLSLIEANIISFLHNNPGRDTANDIVELRMLAKGNVSQAVESLIRKSLIQRRQDQQDRRKIHLSLLPEALPITQAVEVARAQFHDEIFQGLSPREEERFVEVNRQIMENAQGAMKRRNLL
jgi:DNA-binding MarR family transcriptional regulator